MASHMDASADTADERIDPTSVSADPIDEHLYSALEATDDDEARYHLREALQLQIATKHDV